MTLIRRFFHALNWKYFFRLFLFRFLPIFIHEPAGRNEVEEEEEARQMTPRFTSPTRRLLKRKFPPVDGRKTEKISLLGFSCGRFEESFPIQSQIPNKSYSDYL